MDFVLDNSVVMRWLLRDRSTSNQHYADDVLDCLARQTAVVPGLWWLELANVIARSERRGLVKQVESDEFLRLLDIPSIQEQPESGKTLLDRTLTLSRHQGISSYDAAYLSLAMQLKLPLATLDEQLRAAAVRIGVPLYQAPV